MAEATLTRAQDLVAQWRTSADGDNPAGPLYASGRYAEADIVAGLQRASFCGTLCTYSGFFECC